MTDLLTTLETMEVMPQIETICLGKLNRRSWHTTMAIRTGPLTVGVRVDCAEAAEAVQGLLSELRAPDLDSQVLPNVSVEFGGSERQGTQRLFLLYRDHEIVSRRRSRDQTLMDLVALLDETPKAATSQSAVLASCIVNPDGHALLLPVRHHKALLMRRAQLEAAGLELLANRLHTLHEGVVLHGTSDPVLESLVREVDGRSNAGTFPISAWCVAAVGTAPFTLSRAQGVFTAFPMMVRRGPDDVAVVLSSLASLGSLVPFVALPQLSPTGLARVVVEMANGASFE